jgi:catechol 2,3-dioxygenase-like lactoylglutathione lyase family enzyme
MKTKIENENLSDSEYDNVNLSGSSFRDVSLAKARFTDVSLAGAQWEDVTLEGAVIRNANCTNLVIEDARYDGMRIDGIPVTELLRVYRAANVTTAQVKRISPMLAVSDMDITLEFYTKVLQFNVSSRSPGYSIVDRDGATIHFMKAESEEVIKSVRGHAEIYVEVEDIAPLWEHVSRFKKDYRVRDLFDRDYGMREFHIGDPNDCLVFVGQKIQ